MAICAGVAAKISYTDFARPYCRVYVADTSAARVQRLLCHEAWHFLCVKKPNHFWVARMLDGRGIEILLWYARHELCVAARRQKRVHRRSVAQTVAPTIRC